jgi:hypothetical protein
VEWNKAAAQKPVCSRSARFAPKLVHLADYAFSAWRSFVCFCITHMATLPLAVRVSVWSASEQAEVVKALVVGTIHQAGNACATDKNYFSPSLVSE